MNYQELYVVCQIDDFNLKVMVNRYFNNKIQVLYKENISNEQFAESGEILNPEATSKVLKRVISTINDIFKINVQRISLSLPSSRLKIYQSQAILNFKELQHKITNTDVNQVIEMTKNIAISSDEVICSIKPYNFKVDASSFNDNYPLGEKGQIISVETLIYSLPKPLYDSQLKVLKATGCELLSITLDQLALVFNLNDDINNLVLVDFGASNTKVSIFSNSALYAINTIKLGFNQIIHALMTKMHCNYNKAEKYLIRVINLNSNYLDDLIVDKYCDSNTKKCTTFTKKDLQEVAHSVINEIIDYVESFITDVVNSNPNIQIIFTGQIINLPGFSAYIKEYCQLKNIKFMISSTPGIDSYEWATLIGVTHYQHNLNLFNNRLITSTNKILDTNDMTQDLVKNNENNPYHSHLNLNYQYNNGNR